MKRRELMLVVAMAAGLTTGAVTLADMSAEAKGRGAEQSENRGGGKSKGAERGDPRGYERSGNPRAAGGPDNPGRGNPHNDAY